MPIKKNSGFYFLHSFCNFIASLEVTTDASCKGNFQATLYDDNGGCVDAFFVTNYRKSGGHAGKPKKAGTFKSRSSNNNPKAVSDNLKEFGLRKRVCFNDKIEVHETYQESKWIVEHFDQSGLANEGTYEQYKKSGGTWFIMEKEYFIENQLNEPSKLEIWYAELNKQYSDKVLIEIKLILEES